MSDHTEEVKQRTAEYTYVEDPVNLRRFIDEYGYDKASDLTGYKRNTLMQIYDGRNKARTFLEFGFEQFYKAQDKMESGEQIYVFSAVANSVPLNTIKAVASSLGINIQKL